MLHYKIFILDNGGDEFFLPREKNKNKKLTSKAIQLDSG